VPTLSIDGTRVDGVLVVETTAGQITLDDLVAHDEDMMCYQQDRLVNEMLEETKKEEETRRGICATM
jgi:hypothetical protein